MATPDELYAAKFAGKRPENTGANFVNIAGRQKAAGIKAPTVTSQSVKKPQTNVIGKAAAVASQTLDIAGAGLGAAARFVGNTPRYLVEAERPLAQGIARLLPGGQNDIKAQNELRRTLDTAMEQTVRAHKNGKMSEENYTRRLDDISKSYQDLGKDYERVLAGTDRGNVVESAALTAATILSAGRYAPTARAVTASGVVATSVASNVATKSISQLMSAVEKIPAAREMILRNATKIATREAQQLAGETVSQWVAREGKQLAIGLLVKRPIFYQSNIGLAEDAYEDMMSGKYGSAAVEAGFIGAQMIGGGPIGWFLNKGKKIMGDIKALALGQGSFIDAISRRVGQNSTWMAQKLLDLRKTDPEKAAQLEKSLRILQEVNLRMAGDDAERAADLFLRTYTDTGTDLTKLSFEELTTRADKWVRSYDTINQTVKSGLIEGYTKADVGKLLPVRWAKHDQYALIDAISRNTPENPGTEQIKAVIDEIADRAGSWGASETLVNQLYGVMNTARATGTKTYKQAVLEGIKGVTTASVKVKGVPKKIAEQLAKDGYIVARPMGKAGLRTPSVDLEDTRKLITALDAGDANAVFEVAQMPHPVLSAISGSLDKSGLSLQSRNEVSYNTLKNALAGTLDGTTVVGELGIKGRNLENGGDVILGRLQQYIENMKAAKVTRGLVGKTLGISRVPAVTDIRQLTVSEIEEALSGAGFRITRSGAKEIHTAVAEAYLKVPLELRGLGDRAVDLLQAAPVIGRANRAYTRVQSALRYTYNPFFRAQEATETAILAHMQANEVAPFLWKYGRSSLDETVTKLEDSGLFRSSLTGEAANDATFGRISANLSKSQRRNLAGLALDIAKRKGTTVEDMIQNHSDEIEDALKIIVQYPSKGVISSPLARTINIAFFPMRYNTKVTYLAAKKLGEMPPSIQLATLTGLYNMKTWLQSDEGLRWRSEHADAIQVFEWITPVGNIDQAMKLFGGSALSNTGGGITAPAELGLLGGLPFGLISQVLDSQGIIQLNRPYVDPKTGTVIPDYIPETTKARAAVALQDLLGMTFSFPGRTLGLPGKASTIREWVSTVIDTKTGEYNKLVREDQLTPLQRRIVDTVKNGGTDDEIDEVLYHSPAEGQYDGYTLPSEQDFVVRPLTEQPFYDKRRGLPSKGKSSPKQKKKALPIPSRGATL